MKFSRVFIFAFLLAIMGFASSAQDIPTPVECGDIVEGEFTENGQNIYYSINMAPGDRFTVNGETIGDFLVFWMGVLSPTSDRITSSNSWPGICCAFGGSQTPAVDSGILSARGDYTIWLIAGGSNGTGIYNLNIGCIKRDGTIIDPGDTAPDAEEPNTTTPAFSGFGFRGVPPVDFSAGVEIQLQLGQPQTPPIAGDVVALYTYTASAGEIATLSLSRVSGDISIGVTVINKDTNEIIFLGGMPSSNNLSVELTFPSDGTYAIGLFRLDTAERTGTSGAVQVSLN